MVRKRNIALVIVLIFVCAFLYVTLKDFRTDRVIVAVLDTGIDHQHPMLADRVKQGLNVAEWRMTSTDKSGHGTHVAGIIARLAPDAEILSVKVINDEDRVKHTWAAILYSIIKGANIINMSYAEPYHFLTDLAIRYGQSKGVVFVASSGNLGIDDVFYPAKYKGVYSIGGWDENRNQLFGNYGQEVNVLAPGYKIRSAALDGGYTVKSGTSMSAAYVSGVIAYLQSQSDQWMDLFEQASVFTEVSHRHEVEKSAVHRKFRTLHVTRLATYPSQGWPEFYVQSESSEPIAAVTFGSAGK